MPASNASVAFFAPLQRHEKRRLHQTWNPGVCGSRSCWVHRWTKHLFLLFCLFRSTYHSFLIGNPCLKEAALIWSSLIGLSQSNIWNYVKDYRRPFRNCNNGVIQRGFFRRVGMVRGLSFFLQKSWVPRYFNKVSIQLISQQWQDNRYLFSTSTAPRFAIQLRIWNQNQKPCLGSKYSALSSHWLDMATTSSHLIRLRNRGPALGRIWIQPMYPNRAVV